MTWQLLCGLVLACIVAGGVGLYWWMSHTVA